MEKRALTLTIWLFVALFCTVSNFSLQGEETTPCTAISEETGRSLPFDIKVVPTDSFSALESSNPADIKRAMPTITPIKKKWNLLVYMAAKNNLHTFALQNLREMMKVGSTDFINIVVQFDGLGDQQIKRYYVEKGQLRLIETLNPSADAKSGTPQSLYQFVKWSTQAFPSDHVMLDVWNHGSGAKDPSIWGRFLMSHRENLFTMNPDTGLLELNKSLMEYDTDISDVETRSIFKAIKKSRGIGFNEVNEEYIDNRQLRLVLDNITQLILGKKIDILFFDACHMSMVEIAAKARRYASFLVGSPEVEPGRGHNYELLLEPLKTKGLSPLEFAKFAVTSYEQEYKGSYAEYTQAAIQLEDFEPVETNFKKLTDQITILYTAPQGKKIFDLIKTIRFSSRYTTEFYDSDYIDAGHFLSSLISKLKDYSTTEAAGNQDVKTTLKIAEDLYVSLKKSIIANVHGPSIPMSHGLGIFFPKRYVHSSYFKLSFDEKTSWSTFLKVFLQHIKPPRALSMTEEF